MAVADRDTRLRAVELSNTELRTVLIGIDGRNGMRGEIRDLATTVSGLATDIGAIKQALAIDEDREQREGLDHDRREQSLRDRYNGKLLVLSSTLGAVVGVGGGAVAHVLGLL